MLPRIKSSAWAWFPTSEAHQIHLSFLKHPVAQDTARTKSRFSRVMDTGTGSEFLMEFLCASKFENLVFQQFSTFHIYSQCTAQCVSQRQTIYTGVVL